MKFCSNSKFRLSLCTPCIESNSPTARAKQMQIPPAQPSDAYRDGKTDDASCEAFNIVSEASDIIWTNTTS